MKKKATRRRAAPTRPWQESYSLGAGFLFLSLLSLASPALASAGALLFALGLYFLIHGRRLEHSGRGSLGEWVRLRAVQALTLIALGIVLMAALPARFLALSLLLQLIGLVQLLILSFAHPARK